MIDLYFAPTANGQRVTVAFEECGLAYRLHKMNLAGGEQHRPEFLRVNPAGLMPAIVDDEGPGGKPITLTQSAAIVIYAAEKSGRFMPTDPVVRAHAMQWAMQAASDISGTSGTIFRLEVTAPEKNPAITDYFKGRLLTFFGDVDRHLDGRAWLAGDAMSFADLMLYPNFAARRALIDAAGGFPNLQRWAAVMGARPAVQKGMAAGT
jgi:GSH-dependent disulfide-bond oxidoreductase